MDDSVSESGTEPAPPAAGPRQQPAGPTGYAIIETGGKQYRVSVGDRLSVEKLPVEPGSDVTFDRVLMLGGAGAARVGTPLVDGASVQARVEEQYRGEKIIVFKYKPKKRYRRKQGHRQSLTRVAITAINA
jgi:large subunit ribosomal protein L21